MCRKTRFASNFLTPINKRVKWVMGLGFRFCYIQEAGARALAEHLPGGLTELSLDFRNCHIGEGGVRAVSEQLPKGLAQLSFDFRSRRALALAITIQ